MPRSAPTRCTQRCGKIATTNGRCDDHQRKAWENTSKRNQLLDPWQWQKAQREQLQREPQCRECGSTHHLHADHITEVADGGALYDARNLQTLCETCHEAKTEAQRRQRASHRQLTDGGGAF